MSVDELEKLQEKAEPPSDFIQKIQYTPANITPELDETKALFVPDYLPIVRKINMILLAKSC